MLYSISYAYSIGIGGRTVQAIEAQATGGYTRARARARRHAQTKAYVYNIR